MNNIILKKSSLAPRPFEGWGTSLCWWAHRLGYDDELAQKSADLFYSKDGLGLNIMRYNIGGGDNPDHKHITRTDSKIPGWVCMDENGKKAFTPSADKNQLNVLRRCIEAAGDEAFVEAFSNSPPYFMTVSGCSSGSHDAVSDNLRKECVDDFATYLADVCEHLEKKMGITVNSLAAMNEPNTDYWRENSGKQEGCHFDAGESQNRILLATSKAMKERGLSHTHITASDETNCKLQLLACKKFTKEVWEHIDRISVHTYSRAWKSLGSYAIKRNIPLWMTETDWSNSVRGCKNGMGPGLWFGKKIIQDLTLLSPQAWIMWQAIGSYTGAEPFDGNFDGPQVDMTQGFWGVSSCDFDKREILLSQKYYCFGQFTRYIRPGMTILPIDRLTVGAYNKDEQRLVIVAINDKAKKRTLSLDLGEFSPEDTCEVIRTSGSLEKGEHWTRLTENKLDGSVLSSSLMPHSITTFILTSKN
ncbi:MAG: hypothetical protein IIX36_04235 [Clostridia bacterium]|nr:hypothetical protein [Clostridia bacterium]